MDVGRGARGPWSPLDLKNLSRKGSFLSFEWEKTNFTICVHLLETFWKNPLMAPPVKICPTTINPAFGIGFANINKLNTFFEGINFCTFDHINDGNCFKPKEIFRNTQSTKIVPRIFNSNYHPIFIKHTKAANNLCDKVKPITSGGLNLPTSSFTARAIITNEKRLILVCERLILVFKVLYYP